MLYMTMKRVELKRIAEFLWKGSSPDEKTPFAQSGSMSQNYEADDNKKPEKELSEDESGKIEGPMSIARKLCFAMSFNVWLLYFLVLAWIIPCRNLNCDTEDVWETNLTSIWPLTNLETLNVERLPSLAMLGYAEGSVYNLVAIRSDDGTFEWNRNLTFIPRVIQCNFEIIFDANKDGVADCLLTGYNDVYAFNASNGHVFWKRNLPSEKGSIVSRFHPTMERDNRTYLFGTCGDKMVVLDVSSGTEVAEVSLPCWTPFDIRIVPNVVANFTFWSMVCDYGDKVEAWGFTEQDVLSRKTLKNTDRRQFTLLYSRESYSGESIDLGCDVTLIPGGPLLLSWSDRVVMVTANATTWERHFPYPLTVASIKIGHFIDAEGIQIAAAIHNRTNSVIYVMERENGTTISSAVLQDRRAQKFHKVVGNSRDHLVLESVYVNYTSDSTPMEKMNFALIEITEKSIDVKNIVTTSGVVDCGYVSRKNSTNGDWPWMVAVTKKMNMAPDLQDSIVCNGFLIDRRHVITSARCPYPKSGLDTLTARIGRKNWYDGEEYKIACITRHPRFVRDQVYDDIAILTLSRDVDTPNFTPICLPDDSYRTKRWDGLIVSKPVWGFFGKSILQFLRVRIISNKSCNKILSKEQGSLGSLGNYDWSFPGAVSSDMLCTVNAIDEWEPCYGSSGAPLMYKDNRNKWVAVGMEVFSFRCTADSPRGNMEIHDYVQWIEENTTNGKDECS